MVSRVKRTVVIHWAFKFLSDKENYVYGNIWFCQTKESIKEWGHSPVKKQKTLASERRWGRLPSLAHLGKSEAIAQVKKQLKSTKKRQIGVNGRITTIWHWFTEPCKLAKSVNPSIMKHRMTAKSLKRSTEKRKSRGGGWGDLWFEHGTSIQDCNIHFLFLYIDIHQIMQYTYVRKYHSN